MTILPERFVRFAIRDLKHDIEKLEGFGSQEAGRKDEYEEWLEALEAYYQENCLKQDFRGEAAKVVDSAHELLARSYKNMVEEGEMAVSELEAWLQEIVVKRDSIIDKMIEVLANQKAKKK